MTYVVQPGDSLYSIARRFNMTVTDIIRQNNLRSSLLNVGQVLHLRLGRGTEQANYKHVVQAGESLYMIAKQYGLSVSELKQLNRLASSNLRIGQELVVSAKPKMSLPQDQPFYTVRASDTLYSIARQFNVTVGHLIKLNGLLSNNLRVGQKLQIHSAEEPANSGTPENNTIHIVAPGESLYSIARQYKLSVAQLMKLNELETSHLVVGQRLRVKEKDESQEQNSSPSPGEVHNTSNPPSGTIIHIVRRGDSLYALARKYGVNINQIRQLNRLNSDLLQVGQKLIITQGNTWTTSPAPEETPEIGIPQEDASLYHLVAPGETLYSIARQYGLSINQIKRLNQLATDQLQLGQKLRVREEASAPSSTPEEDTEGFIGPIDPTYTLNPRQLPFQMKSFIEARKIFQLETASGEEIFGSGLKGAVGRNHVNRPEDLEKVQRRLIQLKILGLNHPESPESIKRNSGVGAITANLIPRTIEAIERFQNLFRVRFWIEHSTRVAMMQTNQFTPGVVVPGDITYKLLREYTEYRLSFPHPHTHQPTQVKFHNFPRSNYTVFYQGVSYAGSSNPEIPISVFRRLGLEEDLALALKYASKHEGNFDAINSYDKAIFSYGFIQFAGNGGGLAPLMASMKRKAPAVFQEYFQKFGIDVSFQIYGEEIRNAQLIVANPYDRGGKYLVKDTEAERVIRSDKQLYGVFIRAGFYLPVVTLQIDSAIRDYVRPALAIRMDIIAGMLRLNQVSIQEFISSPMGLTLLIDLTINQWVNRAREVFREAIEKVAMKQSLYSRAELQQIDERQVITQIISDARSRQDQRLVQRATNILHSGLSWRKKNPQSLS